VTPCRLVIATYVSEDIPTSVFSVQTFLEYSVVLNLGQHRCEILMSHSGKNMCQYIFGILRDI
jgi:hypothetical protein